VHESPAVMTLPLIFLAILSAIGGYIGIPHYLFPQEEPDQLNMKVAVISSIIAVLGLFFSYMIYGKRTETDPLVKKLGGFYTVLQNKFYFDAVYGWYVDHIQQNIAICLENIEKGLIVRIFADGLAKITQIAGQGLRHLQNGIVQSYALIFVLGAILLFLFLVKLYVLVFVLSVVPLLIFLMLV